MRTPAEPTPAPQTATQDKAATSQMATAPAASQQLKNQAIALCLAIVICLGLLACAVYAINYHTHTQANDQAEQEEPHAEARQQTREQHTYATHDYAIPARMLEDSGLPIAREGADTSDLPQVELYFDLLCPWCARLDERINPTLVKLVESGQVQVALYPLDFLNRLSTDDYSNRAASALTTVVQQEPLAALKYLGLLLSQEHQPSESEYVSVSNEQLAQLAQEAGVSTAVAQQIPQELYRDWVHNNTQSVTSRSELVRPGAKGFTTPLLRVNGKIVEPGSDPEAALLAALGIKE